MVMGGEGGGSETRWRDGRGGKGEKKTVKPNSISRKSKDLSKKHTSYQENPWFQKVALQGSVFKSSQLRQRIHTGEKEEEYNFRPLFFRVITVPSPPFPCIPLRSQTPSFFSLLHKKA